MRCMRVVGWGRGLCAEEWAVRVGVGDFGLFVGGVVGMVWR